MSRLPAASVRVLILMAVATPTAWVAPLDGQELRVALEGGQIRDALNNAGTGAVVRPELLWRRPDGSARLGGLVSVLGERVSVGGFAAADESVPVGGAFHLRIGGDGSAVRMEHESLYRGRVGAALGLGGRWGGLEGGPFTRWSGRRTTGSPAGAGGLFGFSPPAGEAKLESGRSTGFQAMAAGRHGALTGRVGWVRERIGSSVGWTDLVASVSVAGGPLTLALEGGHRGGDVKEGWGALRLGLEVAAGVQLTGEVGSFPSDPLGNHAGGEVGMVGVSLSGGPPRRGSAPLSPVPLPDGRTRLVLRAPSGSRVELLGDWSRWTAQPAGEVEPGLFAADVRLEPGVHRFAFRVDGRWTVPPGYRLEPDEYGGSRAVLEIRAETDQEKLWESGGSVRQDRRYRQR